MTTGAGYGKGGNSFFTVVWLTIYLAAALLVTVRLWLLSDAHCLFLYFGQLQCAYVEVGPSRIAPLMPLLRWAALMSTGTFKLSAIWSFLFSCPARAFFVLGVVGKGSPSSPRIFFSRAGCNALSYHPQHKRQTCWTRTEKRDI